MFDCGVPVEHCNGGVTTNHQSGPSGPRGTYKCHGTAEEARKCQKRYFRKVNEGRGPNDPIMLPPGKPTRLRRMHKKANRLMIPKIRG